MKYKLYVHYYKQTLNYDQFKENLERPEYEDTGPFDGTMMDDERDPNRNDKIPNLILTRYIKGKWASHNPSRLSNIII